MKDEIKDILARLSRYVITPDVRHDFDDLLDYINNLQEELKSANESISWWQNRFNAVKKENERLKKDYGRLMQDNAYTLELEQRNEKAVEYIENENICREELPKYARIEINNFDKKYRNDLLNILQGDDK